MSELQVATAQDVITDAMLLMLAQTPGEPIPAHEMTFGLRELNRMLGKHSAIRNFCFNAAMAVYTFGSVKNAYTIGPSGADFTGPRPTRVLDANIIITGGAEPVYCHLDIIDDQQWMAITVRAIPTAVPTKLYYDSGYTSVGLTGGVPNPGYGTLYFFGQPQASYQVELLVPSALQNFTALSGAGGYFIAPPPYEEFVVTSLAEVLCDSYDRPIPASLERRARKARAAVVSLNSKAPIANTDFPGSNRGGGYFNWLSREIV